MRASGGAITEREILAMDVDKADEYLAAAEALLIEEKARFFDAVYFAQPVGKKAAPVVTREIQSWENDRRALLGIPIGPPPADPSKVDAAWARLKGQKAKRAAPKVNKKIQIKRAGE